MLISTIGTALIAIGLLAPSAMSTPTKPGYERFAGCPSPAEVPGLFVCQRTVIDGGHFQMGSKDVPITSPITLSGGVAFDGKIFANSQGGMSAAKQKVPGGVIGLTGLTWLAEFLGSEALTLWAVTEIAGQPQVGAGLETVSLPIRVHLENTALGKNCYVGSFTNPIKLNLTYGTTSPPPPNTPISGEFPTQGESDLPLVERFENGVLVDNSFAAPGASGCVLTLFGFIPISINGLVNTQSGLPAAAGTNETKQHVDRFEFTLQSTVYP
ncbi:MAG TPA: hypothetical protein VN752_02540 [Solirubrobacterales bacterium]|nr:hypothetical protein [Solirubrobacterales bacterium]